MSWRKSKGDSSSNPPLCLYNPNYNVVDKHKKSINIFKLVIAFDIKIDTKQKLLNKIWRGYNPDSEYKSVNLKTAIEADKY